MFPPSDPAAGADIDDAVEFEAPSAPPADAEDGGAEERDEGGVNPEAEAGEDEGREAASSLSMLFPMDRIRRGASTASTCARRAAVAGRTPSTRLTHAAPQPAVAGYGGCHRHRAQWTQWSG